MKAKNRIKVCVAIFLGLFTMFVFVPSVNAENNNYDLYNTSGDYVVMKRLYNHNTGDHCYEIYKSSVRTMLDNGYRLEKGSLLIDKTLYSRADGVPVYILYNTRTQSKFYTANSFEQDLLLSLNSKNYKIQPTWQWCVGFLTPPANQGIPVYRLYNPNSWRGTHHFTPIQAEKDMLVRLGWRYEGIGFYVSGVLNE
ncbi:hypothetical protein [uncultured Enterococcus sp.]|uniref:hypothetical protein n=1 Tax=uncultured Enterococcus sp. TaxID=167972 RepID=UPI0026341CF7|nr:hypothetical protein [uncultured Enterococcus sp.]